MDYRTLGRTDLVVSRLGAGLSEIGYELTRHDVAEAGRVLNAALDGGITFLDTAACYNVSEELVGRAVGHRRDEFVLATKAGHVTGGYRGEPWTRRTILDSIDRSLERLQTDHVDLVQLHSCGVDILARGEVIEALEDARRAGKTRYIGYSGDNAAAQWAVADGRFDTLQTSYNLVDQAARRTLFDQAKAQGMGIIVKRPIANGAWGAASAPSTYAGQYWERAQQLQALGELPAAPHNRIWLALAFVLAQDQVDTAIVGTRNPRHMQANLTWLATEPHLDAATVAELQRRYDAVADDWPQLG